jgi:hypothetical protein
MPATARLIVMMQDDEKSALEAQAAAAQVSTAELARRRLFGREAPDEEALRQLLTILRPVVRRAGRALDANLVEIRRLRGAAAARDAAVVERARREMTVDELDAIAERVAVTPPRRTRR